MKHLHIITCMYQNNFYVVVTSIKASESETINSYIAQAHETFFCSDGHIFTHKKPIVDYLVVSIYTQGNVPLFILVYQKVNAYTQKSCVSTTIITATTTATELQQKTEK